MAVRLSNRPKTLNNFIKYNRIPIFRINWDGTPFVKPNIQDLAGDLALRPDGWVGDFSKNIRYDSPA